MGPAQRRRSPGVEVEKGRAPGVPEEIPPAPVPLAIDPGARFAGSLGRERETPRGWRNPAGQGEHDRRTNRPDWPCNTGSDLCRVPAPAAVGRILHVYSSAGRAGRRADRGPASLARVRAGPQGETVLQDRLHRARPGAVGMSGLQVLAPSQEVGQARLMRRLLEAAIGHPTVPHQHTGEVGAEHRRRLGEPPAVADGVDRRLRGGERPQPVEDRVHPPAGLIRRDHRTAADLLAQRRIRGRRRVGGAVTARDLGASACRGRMAESLLAVDQWPEALRGETPWRE